MKKVIFILAGLFLMISFQNCSRVATAPSDEFLSFKSGAMDDGELMAESADDEDAPDVVAGEDIGYSEDQASENPPSAVPPKKSVNDDDGGAVPPPENDDDGEAARYCADMKKNAIHEKKVVFDLSEIKNENGAMYVSTDMMSVVDANNGKLVIFPHEANSVAIEKISAKGGNLILCNAVVGEITDSNGTISLYNSTVGLVKDKVGNLKLHNSTVQAYENFNGPVK